MKRLKKLLLPLSLLVFVPLTTIPVVACSQTSNKDNINQSTPPSQPSPQNQSNINRNYALSSEFAEHYTKAMFEENIKLFEKFDGSNELWINSTYPDTNIPIRYCYQKDYTCLHFQAYGNTVEIKLKMLMNTQTPTPNNWIVYEEYNKFEYISPTKIKETTFSSYEPTFSSYEPTPTIPMEEFKGRMKRWTLSGWKDFVANNAGQWVD